MNLPEWKGDIAFRWVNYRSLNLFVFIFLLIWLIFIAYFVSMAYSLTEDFIVFTGVWQVITLYPLLGIIRKLKIKSGDKSIRFGVWEQATLGFYVISNLGILIFLSVVTGYLV